jgi:CDP-glucose 4,6-dehydratase
MGGKDPYSASKGCSELVTAAYLNSFFNTDSTVIASARAGNVIGGGDWAEDRIVPDFFRAYQAGKKVMLRNPDYTRPWQHVLEPLSGYLQLAAKLYREGKEYSGGWNFGPLDGNHYSVEKLVTLLVEYFGKGGFEITEVRPKVHEAHLLKLDISKSTRFLDWAPVLNFRETVDFTVKGYQDELSAEDVYRRRVSQIESYVEIAKSRRIKWVS